ncbi:MAG: isopentenyl-diphosphate delta-isomerase, partial [Woeseiaceae bacterium]
SAELEFVYRFTYQAAFGELGSENEMCHVFLGFLAEEPQANETEIEALRYVSAASLDQELVAMPEVFTPWFKLEWEHLKSEFAETLARYTNPA